MMKFLTKLAQKPTDKSIRIVRIVFALFLLLVIYFGWNITVVNFGLPTEVKYGFYLFPLVGLVRGVIDPGIVRKKIWKWIVVAIGVIMLLSSLIFIDDQEINTNTSLPTTSGEISIDSIVVSELDAPFTLSTDNWF